MNTVTIILTDIEAEKWQKFQKNYELFEALNSKGVLDMEFGKTTINIAYGEVQNIVKEEVVWKRKLT